MGNSVVAGLQTGPEAAPILAGLETRHHRDKEKPRRSDAASHSSGTLPSLSVLWPVCVMMWNCLVRLSLGGPCVGSFAKSVRISSWVADCPSSRSVDGCGRKAMDYVTVALSPRWRTFVNSPYFTAISSLTGVAVTFCPLFLYQAGRSRCQHPHEVWSLLDFFGGPDVWLLYLIIYLVPGFHMMMAGNVLRALLARSNPSSPTIKMVAVHDGEVDFALSDGRRIVVPTSWHEGLSSASGEQLNAWTRSETGRSVTWSDLHVRVSVHDLLSGYPARARAASFWNRFTPTPEVVE